MDLQIHAESADIVKEISQLPNLDTEGLFTHFARADETDKTPAEVQLSRYLAFSRLLEDRGVEYYAPSLLQQCRYLSI